MSGHEDQVAVWYHRHFGIEYQLFDTEDQAAGFAVYTEDYGEGVIAGVQFADGRTIAKGEWAAFARAEQKQREDESRRDAERAAAPPRPLRKVKAPFGMGQVEIDLDDPDWLGER